MAAAERAIDLAGLEKRLRAIEVKQVAIEELFTQFRAEIADCYQTLGNMEAILLKMKKALK